MVEEEHNAHNQHVRSSELDIAATEMILAETQKQLQKCKIMNQNEMRKRKIKHQNEMQSKIEELEQSNATCEELRRQIEANELRINNLETVVLEAGFDIAHEYDPNKSAGEAAGFDIAHEYDPNESAGEAAACEIAIGNDAVQADHDDLHFNTVIHCPSIENDITTLMIINPIKWQFKFLPKSVTLAAHPRYPNANIGFITFYNWGHVSEVLAEERIKRNGVHLALSVSVQYEDKKASQWLKMRHRESTCTMEDVRKLFMGYGLISYCEGRYKDGGILVFDSEANKDAAFEDLQYSNLEDHEGMFRITLSKY